MHVVLAYDVRSNTRRTRLHKKLKQYLAPVQKSVFEGRLEGGDLERVEALIIGTIDMDTDRARVWFLSATTVKMTRSYGTMPEPEDPDEPILIG